MPGKNETLSQKGMEAAGAGAQQALTAVLPDAAYRVWHWCFYSEVSLTNVEQIEQFNSLYQELEPFCDAGAAEHLPQSIADCWRCFSFEKVRASVYQFKSVINLKDVNQHYAQMASVNGQTYRDFPLTLSVLRVLSTAKSLQRGSKQNLAKIVLGYVAMVVLELSILPTASDQYDVAEHLKKVVDILVQRESYRTFFDDNALDALKELSRTFQHFLATPHAIRDAEFIPRAVEKFALYQVQLVSQLFKALLILTEGGNKRKLTFDYALIAKGHLNAKHLDVTFHPMNPFRDLLKYAANFIPDLHESTSRQLKIQALQLPEMDKIKAYLTCGIRYGYHIRGARWMYGDDPVLYLLEQKIDTSQTICWSTESDVSVQNESAQQLYRLADWVRFHLYIADKIVNLKFLLSTEGQRWLAYGEEKQLIQLFITRHDELLHTFQDELRQLRRYLSVRIRTNVGLEHNILGLLGQGSDQLVKKLIERGVQPLLNIEERFTQIVPRINAVRASFFSDISRFLNSSGYAFQLPLVGGSPESVTPPLSPPLVATVCRPRQLQDSTQQTVAEAVSLPPRREVVVGAHHTNLAADLFLSETNNVDENYHADDEGQPLRQATYNELAQLLTSWISPYWGRHIDEKKRGSFLAFWRQLCFIGRANRSSMQDYHTHILHEAHKMRQLKVFYQHIQTHLESVHPYFQTWARDTITTLAGKDIACSLVLSAEWIKHQIEDQDASLSALQKKAREFKLKRMKLIPSSRLAWPDDVYQKLERFILKMHDESHNMMSVETCLDWVSHHLLQGEIDRDKQDTLDDYLTDVFNHLSQCDDEKERAFCEEILRGLMMLGANPLVWMDEKMQEQSCIDETQGRGYFIAAQQVRIILSHFEHRATYLGDSVVYLKEKLDAVFTTTIAFADRLYACVQDDESWWWKLAEFLRIKNKGGARLERAEIYWAVLKWVYVLLNEELADHEFDTESQAYLDATTQLELAKQHYQHVVPEKKRLYNQGSQTWLDLNHALTNLSEEVRRLRSERHSYVVAETMVRQQAHQQIEENRRALKRAEQAVIVATKEREAAYQAQDQARREKESAYRLCEIERTRREASERKWYLRELHDAFLTDVGFKGQDREFQVLIERVLNRVMEGEALEHRAEKYREISAQLASVIATTPQLASLHGHMQRYMQSMRERTPPSVTTQSMFRAAAAASGPQHGRRLALVSGGGVK